MQITTNIAEVTAKLMGQFEEIKNPEFVSRAVATALMPQIRERIHERGENSKGQQIGTYSNSYLRLRQRKYNRTADTDVIASLSRQLENSYVLGPDGEAYSMSVATQLSVDKITWLEEKYGKIWELTESERNDANLVAAHEAQLILDK